MPRYFIEVSYKGTSYAGFQVQHNANTVQAEVEKAMQIYFRSPFVLTCSSRTDAGVHALQNFFHFDWDNIQDEKTLHKAVYHINAILPDDIVIKKIFIVHDDAHCRFDALSREYRYTIYQEKDPFLQDRAYYFPYQLDFDLLQRAADNILGHKHFETFSKRNTQVKTFVCDMYESKWQMQSNVIRYSVKANRFLRGMVRGLVGTMLKVGTGKMSVNEFHEVILSADPAQADFSVPPQGLMLMKVDFPEQYVKV
jgi:tRNA pseudouridine38-40 synthase